MIWILFLLGQLVLSYAEPKSFVYVSEVEEDILPPALRLSGRRSQQRYSPPPPPPQGDRYSVTEKRVPPPPAPPIAGNVPPLRSSIPKIISDVASKIASLSPGNNAPLSSRTSDFSSATSGKVAPSRFPGNSSPRDENSYSNSQNSFNPSSNAQRNSQGVYGSSNAQRNTQNVYGSSNPFNDSSLSGGKFNLPPSSSGDRHNYPPSVPSPGRNYPSRSSSGNTYSSRNSGDNFLSRSSPGISDRDSSLGSKENIFPPPRSYGNLGIPSIGNDLRNLNHTSSRQLTSRNVNPFNYQNQGFSSSKDQYSSSNTPNIPSQLSLQKINKAPNKKEKALTPCELLRDREEVKLPLTTFRFFDENQPSSNFKEDRSGQNQNFRNDAGRRGRNTPDRERSLNKNRQTYYSPIDSFNTGSPQGQTYVQLPNRNSNGPVLVGYQYNRSPTNFPSQSRQNKPNLNIPPPNFNRHKLDNAPQQNNKPGFNNPDSSERSTDPFGKDGRSYNDPSLENLQGNQNIDERLSDKDNNAPNFDNKKRPNYSSQTSGLINQGGRNSQNFNNPSQSNRNKNINPPQIYYSNKQIGRTLPGSGLSINNYGRSYSSYRPTVSPERYPSESFEKATFGTAYITIAPLPLDVDGDEIPGKAGVDYPTYHVIPTTSFTCDQVPFNGYYADMEASCQVVHFCQSGGVQNSFLCPNGTIFSQKKFSCQWWYKTNCTESPHYFSLNSDLYKIPVKKLT